MFEIENKIKTVKSYKITMPKDLRPYTGYQVDKMRKCLDEYKETSDDGKGTFSCEIRLIESICQMRWRESAYVLAFNCEIGFKNGEPTPYFMAVICSPGEGKTVTMHGYLEDLWQFNCENVAEWYQKFYLYGAKN